MAIINAASEQFRTNNRPSGLFIRFILLRRCVYTYLYVSRSLSLVFERRARASTGQSRAGQQLMQNLETP